MTKTIGLYYEVKEDVTFEVATQEILELLKAANYQSPYQNRILYIDIEGHLDDEGEYDRDMKELQQEFIVGFLLEFFTEIHTPIKSYKNSTQNNSIPEKLDVLKH